MYKEKISNTVKNKNIAILSCFTSALFFFFTFAQDNILNSLGPFIKEQWQLTPFQFTLLSSSYLLALALACIPAGWLLDKYNPRYLLLTGMFFCIVCTVIFTYASHFYIAILARVLIGCIQAISFVGAMRLAAAWNPKHEALAIGFVVTIGLLGGVVVQYPLMYLIAYSGWQGAMNIVVCIGVIIFLLMLVFLKNPPSIIQNKKHYKGFFKQLLLVGSKLQNWLYSFYTSIFNIPIIVFGALWGNIYLIDVGNYSKLEASFLFMMLFWGVIIGAPLIGMISDFYKTRVFFMRLFGIVGTIAMFIIYFSIGYNILTLSLLFIFLGICISVQALTYSKIQEINSPTSVGIALGFSAVIITIGGAFFQLIFAEIITLGSYLQFSLNHSYDIGFLVLGLFMILGIGITFFTKE